ncbi:hypothetical protein TNCV_4809931 [Trichonephila clavipes]|uniref:Uncharacterized protein n=1 Tax=Trichonephila clavipes TaxID=2585209 RepID=A0A8X6RYY8_TRICX|nr:hypothetical protein TNCV_4809931 [Trichonephila clavipes]
MPAMTGYLAHWATAALGSRLRLCFNSEVRCSNHYATHVLYLIGKYYRDFYGLNVLPPGGSTVYQLLHSLINHPVTNRVAKNDANLALPPTFRYVSIESPL